MTHALPVIFTPLWTKLAPSCEWLCVDAGLLAVKILHPDPGQAAIIDCVGQSGSVCESCKTEQESQTDTSSTAPRCEMV
jgi:hypothetical protein